MSIKHIVPSYGIGQNPDSAKTHGDKQQRASLVSNDQVTFGRSTAQAPQGFVGKVKAWFQGLPALAQAGVGVAGVGVVAGGIALVTHRLSGRDAVANEVRQTTEALTHGETPHVSGGQVASGTASTGGGSVPGSGTHANPPTPSGQADTLADHYADAHGIPDPHAAMEQQEWEAALPLDTNRGRIIESKLSQLGQSTRITVPQLTGLAGLAERAGISQTDLVLLAQARGWPVEHVERLSQHLGFPADTVHSFPTLPLSTGVVNESGTGLIPHPTDNPLLDAYDEADQLLPAALDNPTAQQHLAIKNRCDDELKRFLTETLQSLPTGLEYPTECYYQVVGHLTEILPEVTLDIFNPVARSLQEMGTFEHASKEQVLTAYNSIVHLGANGRLMGRPAPLEHTHWITRLDGATRSDSAASPLPHTQTIFRNGNIVGNYANQDAAPITLHIGSHSMDLPPGHFIQLGSVTKNAEIIILPKAGQSNVRKPSLAERSSYLAIMKKSPETLASGERQFINKNNPFLVMNAEGHIYNPTNLPATVHILGENIALPSHHMLEDLSHEQIASFRRMAGPYHEILTELSQTLHGINIVYKNNLLPQGVINIALSSAHGHTVTPELLIQLAHDKGWTRDNTAKLLSGYLEHYPENISAEQHDALQAMLQELPQPSLAERLAARSMGTNAPIGPKELEDFSFFGSQTTVNHANIRHHLITTTDQFRRPANQWDPLAYLREGNLLPNQRITDNGILITTNRTSSGVTETIANFNIDGPAISVHLDNGQRISLMHGFYVELPSDVGISHVEGSNQLFESNILLKKHYHSGHSGSSAQAISPITGFAHGATQGDATSVTHQADDSLRQAFEDAGMLPEPEAPGHTSQVGSAEEAHPASSVVSTAGQAAGLATLHHGVRPADAAASGVLELPTQLSGIADDLRRAIQVNGVEVNRLIPGETYYPNLGIFVTRDRITNELCVVNLADKPQLAELIHNGGIPAGHEVRVPMGSPEEVSPEAEKITKFLEASGGKILRGRGTDTLRVVRPGKLAAEEPLEGTIGTSSGARLAEPLTAAVYRGPVRPDVTIDGTKDSAVPATVGVSITQIATEQFDRWLSGLQLEEGQTLTLENIEAAMSYLKDSQITPEDLLNRLDQSGWSVQNTYRLLKQYVGGLTKQADSTIWNNLVLSLSDIDRQLKDIFPGMDDAQRAKISQSMSHLLHIDLGSLRLQLSDEQRGLLDNIIRELKDKETPISHSTIIDTMRILAYQAHKVDPVTQGVSPHELTTGLFENLTEGMQNPENIRAAVERIRANFKEPGFRLFPPEAGDPAGLRIAMHTSTTHPDQVAVSRPADVTGLPADTAAIRNALSGHNGQFTPEQINAFFDMDHVMARQQGIMPLLAQDYTHATEQLQRLGEANGYQPNQIQQLLDALHDRHPKAGERVQIIGDGALTRATDVPRRAAASQGSGSVLFRLSGGRLGRGPQ